MSTNRQMGIPILSWAVVMWSSLLLMMIMAFWTFSWSMEQPIDQSSTKANRTDVQLLRLSSKSNGSKTDNENNDAQPFQDELDCGMRQLMFEMAAKKLGSWRTDSSDIYEALELETRCRRNRATTATGSWAITEGNSNNDNTEKAAIASASSGKSDDTGATMDSSVGEDGANPNDGSSGSKIYYYVCPEQQGDDCEHCLDQGGQGNRTHPFRTIRAALRAARRNYASTAAAAGIDNNKHRTINLLSGVHFLSETIVLTVADSDLTIQASPDAEPGSVWLSGGVRISGRNAYNSATMRNPTTWKQLQPPPTPPASSSSSSSPKRNHNNSNHNIWVANLTSILPTTMSSTVRISSLFTLEPHQRMTLARYPNADVEDWNARDRYVNSKEVKEWIFPPFGGQSPHMIAIDLAKPGNPTGYVKTDSAMSDYNSFGTGQGGVCATVWGNEPSYWCSNVSAGGWAEVDRAAALAGRLNIPVGMVLQNDDNRGPSTRGGGNADDLASRVQNWKHHEHARGAIVHVAHTQGWAWHMFNISSITAGNNRKNADHGGGDGSSRSSSKNETTTVIHFDAGGWQGGRNWQCKNAQGRLSDCDGADKKLTGGNWYVEGVLEELDAPGEFYFDDETKLLYFYPPSAAENGIETNHPGEEQRPTEIHSTEATMVKTRKLPQEEDLGTLRSNHGKTMIPDLVAPHLQTLIRIAGTKINPVRNVRLRGLGFRDAAKTYMEQWSAPSGGDWALHRGGAVFLDGGTEYVTISNCTFTRLDGNAIMLSGYNRYAQIRRSEFAWLGNGAVATWGYTDNKYGYDATGGAQPQSCTMEENVVSNIGLYQKQSSGWGQAKSYNNTIRNNVMFNVPRAAINFNDGMGGGNLVQGNVIFNTCRESGDHGPINSWDRMPFLTNATGVPSFTPAVTITTENFIMANYHGSQGFDNDDGSSFYHTHHNVFYDADGFKMDYGGHDSIFNNNLVYGEQCFGTGSFRKGHSDKLYNNRCIITGIRNPNFNVGQMFQCSVDGLILFNNSYYTNSGSGTWSCCGSDSLSLEEMHEKLGAEIGSTVEFTPSASSIILWAKDMLGV